MIKAYIFDQDGTLYSKKSKIISHAREKTKSWIRKSLGWSKNKVDRCYKKLPKEYPNPFCGFESLGLDLCEYHREVYDKINPRKFVSKKDLFSGILDLDSPIFVVTLASRAYSEELQRALGIKNKISETFYVIDYLPEKEKFPIYEEIRLSLGLRRNEIMIIGDNYLVDLKKAELMGYQIREVS